MYAKDITTREEITELMQPGGPAAIIDFWAAWCGPCRAMAPHFEEAARQMEEEDVTFYKLDTQKHPELAKAFNVRSLPTVMAIHDGQIQDVFIGARDAHSLTQIAKTLVSRASGEGFLKRIFGGNNKAS